MKNGRAKLALLCFIASVLPFCACADGDFNQQKRINKIKNKIASLHQTGKWSYRFTKTPGRLSDHDHDCANSSPPTTHNTLARIQTASQRDAFNNFMASVLASNAFKEGDCFYIDLQLREKQSSPAEWYWIWGKDQFGPSSRYDEKLAQFEWIGGMMPRLSRDTCTCVSLRTGTAHGYSVQSVPMCEKNLPGICQSFVDGTSSTGTIIAVVIVISIVMLLIAIRVRYCLMNKSDESEINMSELENDETHEHAEEFSPEHPQNSATGYDPTISPQYPQNSATGYDPTISPEYAQNSASGYDPTFSQEYGQNSATGYDPTISLQNLQNSATGYDPTISQEYAQNSATGCDPTISPQYPQNSATGYAPKISQEYLQNSPRGYVPTVFPRYSQNSVTGYASRISHEYAQNYATDNTSRIANGYEQDYAPRKSKEGKNEYENVYQYENEYEDVSS